MDKKNSKEALIRRRATTIADMLAKVEGEDWHGVQDCGSDLREIDAKLEILAEALK